MAGSDLKVFNGLYSYNLLYYLFHFSIARINNLRNTHETANHNVLIALFIDLQTIVLVNCHALGKNEEYFDDGKEFKPERWLRENNNINPFAYVPFGVGKRMCIGKRLAELQIQLAMCWVRSDRVQFSLQTHQSH